MEVTSLLANAQIFTQFILQLAVVIAIFWEQLLALSVQPTFELETSSAYVEVIAIKVFETIFKDSHVSY